MFDQVDTMRRNVSSGLDSVTRAELGQFMTPSRIARFMTSLLDSRENENISILDAGAGIGSLTAAFLERIETGWGNFSKIHARAFEIDPALLNVLEKNFGSYKGQMLKSGITLTSQIQRVDFIEQAVEELLNRQAPVYDYVILNPPYRKINKNASHRRLLRTVGIETVNLYAAFVALSLLQMKSQGQLVAIVPRSFCNGPYYKMFRELMLERAAIRRIHLFESRSKAFGEDAVLQENIIIHLVKDEIQGKVSISTSADATFADLRITEYDFDQIVKANDSEKFIHIPTRHEENALSLPSVFSFSLKQIGVEVSTGPIVDFRVKEYLRQLPEEDTVPLLYPGHFIGMEIDWPKVGFKKPNAIVCNDFTEKWLYPVGYYVTVKRFSTKEEKKRIVARIVSPETLDSAFYGFENHLNVFHFKKKGLSPLLALGLTIYLNSTLVDNYFRQFNGHTQVNATDLRLLTYPSKDALEDLGRWGRDVPSLEQSQMDRQVESLI